MAKVFNIKQFVFDYSIPQSELSDVLGLKQPQVSLLLNGKRKILEKHEEAMRAKYGSLIDPYFVEKKVSIGVDGVTIFPAAVIDDIKNELSQPKAEDMEVIDAEEVELKVTPILTPDIVNQPGLDIKQGLEDGTLPVQFKPTQDIVPDRVVKVYLENDEMAPDIEANDPVLIRLMDDKNAIVHGRMYFVDLYRGAVVRWVFPQNDGTLLLKSKNAPDMIVQPESVKSISEVVTIWKRPKCLPNDHVSMFEELRRRDDQMDELLAQQGRLIGIIEKHN